MKVTSENTSQEITRRFTIDEDRPVVHMAYSDPPKKVVVERGHISYTFDADTGRWIAKDYWSITVAGTVLKKDGTPSKNDHKRHAAEDYRRGQAEYVPAEDWKWMGVIVDLLRPKGTVATMKLNGTEVQA